MGQIDTKSAVGYEVLSTKLAPPRLNQTFVPRESLLAQLDEGLEKKLTLISAPAGFGKTTLVSEWIAERRKHNTLPPIAWVALDSGDNDPLRFWLYVLTACQTFGSDIGMSALALLRDSPQSSFEAVLTLFINDVALLSNNAILVLEDYHFIEADQIHETLAYLIDHLPVTLHVILMTRSDPPLPLARLRARNDLNELRAADLRFTLDETRSFLQQTVPFPLHLELAMRLSDRTEGWAAGLRLVALALRGKKAQSEIEQYLAGFTGSNRAILDYLVTDVFSTLPENIQELLLQTSVLSRLTGTLCDTVTGRNDSALILEQLEADNLFLVSLDASQKWYRFHLLFVEAMQHLAQQRLGEARLIELFRKASSWYEEHGMLVEAVEASLSARDFSKAVDLIERVITPQFVNPEYYTLRRWLEQLPEEVMKPRPMLSFTYAVAILYTSDRRSPGTIALLQKPLEMAEKVWRAEGNQSKLAQVLIFQTMASWFQSGSLKALAGARQALEMLPEEDVFWISLSLIGVGLEELLAGTLNDARQTMLKARAACKAAGNVYGSLSATFFLGEIYARQGAPGQAARLYRQVLDGVSDEVHRPIVRLTDFDRGRALIGLGAVFLEWNDLDTAEQYLSEALEIGQKLPDEELQVRSSLLLARLLHIRGETEQARERLQTLIPQTSNRWPLLVREALTGQAQLAQAAGDMKAVEHWFTTTAQLNSDVSRIQQEQEQFTVARMLIAQDRAGEALSLLESWQADAHAQGRVRSELEIMILSALAYFNQYNLPKARQILMEALTLAKPEGYQRIFLDERETIAAMLRETLPEIQDPSQAGYANVLLYTIAQERARREDFSQKHSELLIEPLTEQEQRVLRLLAMRFTTPEIARELFISANTVKTHVSHIYSKLGVNSREQARQAARHLKLL